MSDNIIKFPTKHKINTHIPEITLEDVKTNIENVKHYHIQESIETIVPMIFNALEVAGFTLLDETEYESLEDVKDNALLVECIRSIMCRFYNMEHPLQKVSEKIFLQDEKNPDVFKIADSLKIKFKTNTDEKK